VCYTDGCIEYGRPEVFMDRYIKTVALVIFVSIFSSLSLKAQDDGTTIQQSPYSSLQEIPSDVPPNPYNNYPYFNNPYPNVYNNAPGYYNGYPSYYNQAPGYNNRYQGPYSPDQRPYQGGEGRGEGRGR
jgi:hypothetical protein